MQKEIWKRIIFVASVLILTHGMSLVNADAKGKKRYSEQKQELIVAVEDDTYQTEKKWPRLGLWPWYVNVCEPLVALSTDYEVIPLLATKWEYVGEKTWRFSLRKGVKFHDGQDFTAEAVKYTLNMIAKDQPWRFGGIGPESIRIIDDYTVEITPQTLNMRLVEQLTHTSWSIMAPGSDPGKAPVGTGPFKFDAYRRDEFITVVQNPDYWGEKARLQRITFKFIPDRETRVLSLEAGDVDMIIRVPTESVSNISTKPGLRILSSKVSSTTYLCCLLNGKAPYDILSDRRVRSAIALAINRESMVKNVWEGNAEVNQTVNLPSVLHGHKELIKGFGYNVDGARAMLDEAGWASGNDGIRVKEGRRLCLTLVSGFPSVEDHRPLPEVIQAQLRKIGVELRIVTAEGGLYSSMLKKKEGDLWLERGPQNDAQPPFLAYLLCHSKGAYSRIYNLPFAPGGKFDELMDDAMSASSMDLCARYTAEALHELIDEKNGVIPVAAHFEIWGVKETVRDFDPHPSHVNQRWNRVYLAQ